MSSGCTQCPRRCGADRDGGAVGLCGAGRDMRVARVMLHEWEEPCLGTPSGAVFFVGCPLRCVYCQNRPVSRPWEPGGVPGEVWDGGRFEEEITHLAQIGAANVDLVSPTQYAGQILEALAPIKDWLPVPVVWNTGGYETVETVRACRGLVDIFLTDFKYGTAETAALYSGAPDYPAVAARALAAMVETVGPPVWEDERLKRGVILRHLILPGGRKDSLEALRLAADAVGAENVVLSLMRQYTPDFAPAAYARLRRRVTTFEYETVRKEALRLGFSGYGQDAAAASCAYTPDFRSSAVQLSPADAEPSFKGDRS